MERALQGRLAWLSGLRRADSADRREVSVVHRDRRGLIKINPLIAWSDDDVAHYIAEHDVPVNPLVAQGYASIRCWPCAASAQRRGRAPGAGTAPARPSAGSTL